MNEREWQTCTDPRKMLECLPRKGIHRKVCLLAIACCRRDAWLMKEKRSVHAVEWTEKLIDGLTAWGSADGPSDDDCYFVPPAANHCMAVAGAGDVEAAIWAAGWVMEDVCENCDSEEEERRSQSALIREIFGPLPFRSITLDPSWFTPTVIRLAETIYQERAFDRLPILADALEETGCGSDELLAHCRQPGVHVKGCWALDLILEKDWSSLTEAEWLECTDPHTMLGFVRGKASDRKVRLFAAACCRRMVQTPGDARFQRVIEGAERYADGLVLEDTLAFISIEAEALAREEPGEVFQVASALARGNWHETLSRSARAVGRADERITQSDLARCVFGNPFHRVTIDPTDLSRAVRELAASTYKARAFDRLPILADALEEAGCGNTDLLNHCRQPGTHVRGCWVIDLLLGKE